MKLVIKLGGFLFPQKPSSRRLREYAGVLKRLADEGHRLLAVTGGGGLARSYINLARKLGADEGTCDQLGIEASRMNARLLALALDDYAFPETPTTLGELKKFFQGGKIVVMGGLTPGHSTMAVGALAAEAVKADCYIIASDVDGIYTADPKVDEEAEKLEEASTAQLLEMAMKKRLWAGSYQLDPLALKVLDRSRIPAYFIDGRKTENLVKAVMGLKVGTRISASR
ncbi:UMP kinase [Candidatus Hecatella orcuttiae]|uniref:UMP kinase n=1 Tax=Candidatus Hecatella orcuttiae TaxID=1935119 RepID=UPI0028680005|nr:UMP kinase [Candidatus Hecatella orcuttiae]